METLHRYDYRVSFGDCDPAGIVFYPNIFKWVDTTFHDWLRTLGGHAAICKQLGAVGIGLMDASGRFRTPLRQNEPLQVQITALEWGGKSLTLHYAGRVDARLAFEATETRGIFIPTDGGLRAGSTSDLRALIEADGR